MDFSKLTNSTTLKTAAVVTVAGLVVSNFTSGKGTLIQGGAAFVGSLFVLAFVVPKI